MTQTTERKTQPDPEKVFTAIARILSRRGEGTVRLVSITRKGDQEKSA